MESDPARKKVAQLSEAEKRRLRKESIGEPRPPSLGKRKAVLRGSGEEEGGTSLGSGEEAPEKGEVSGPALPQLSTSKISIGEPSLPSLGKRKAGLSRPARGSAASVVSSASALRLGFNVFDSATGIWSMALDGNDVVVPCGDPLRQGGRVVNAGGLLYWHLKSPENEGLLVCFDPWGEEEKETASTTTALPVRGSAYELVREVIGCREDGCLMFTRINGVELDMWLLRDDVNGWAHARRFDLKMSIERHFDQLFYHIAELCELQSSGERLSVEMLLKDYRLWPLHICTEKEKVYFVFDMNERYTHDIFFSLDIKEDRWTKVWSRLADGGFFFYRPSLFNPTLQLLCS